MNELTVIDINEMIFNKQVDLVNLVLSKEQEIYELKKQEQEISNKRKYNEAQLEKFKDNVKTILEVNGIETIETDVGKISVRQNPISVEIEDENKIPAEFKQLVQTIKVDKKRIIDYFKQTGEIIDGVKINTQNTSLQVK